MSWLDDAACKGHPTSWWYRGEEPGHRVLNRDAETICASCPVSDDCRQAAEKRREYDGLWGGEWFDETDRVRQQRWRRRHRNLVAGTESQARVVAAAAVVRAS